MNLKIASRNFPERSCKEQANVKRAFLNQLGSSFRLALERLAQSLLLPIVKTLCLCHLVAGKG